MKYPLEKMRALAASSPYEVPSDVIARIQSVLERITYKTSTKKRDEMGEIITLFNNITADNYEMQYIKLIGTIETPPMVSAIFFDKVNFKYSTPLYADLYVRLMGKDPAFGRELTTRIETHFQNLKNVAYVDAVDYDALCEQKTAADRRMAFSKLLVCMQVFTTLPLQPLVDMLTGVISENLTMQKRNEVDEWVDHVMVLMKCTAVDPAWLKRVVEQPMDISSRTLFKLQDSLSGRC
jgi:hypothetical protein